MRHLIKVLNTQDHHLQSIFILIFTTRYSVFVPNPPSERTARLSWYGISKEIPKTVIYFLKL